MREDAPPLELTGLSVAPAQQRGAFRLVPVIRDRECHDVRLARSELNPDIQVVDVPGNAAYTAFVPHGMRLSWGDAVGAQVLDKKRPRQQVSKLRQRQGDTLHFLPQHVALEGFLGLHFGPPSIGWAELSEPYRRWGVMCRMEFFDRGRDIPGYADALRTFEIHRGQVGILVYASDALMAAFIMPSAEDYRLIHRSLLDELYGELMEQYALYGSTIWLVEAEPYFAQAHTLSSLRDALGSLRQAWEQATVEQLWGDWRDRRLRTQLVYRPKDMRLERFVTDLTLNAANHIGERLVRQDGELLYLNTLRLSASQTRRAHILATLADHQWQLAAAAEALRTDIPGVIGRLEAQGFGYLINHNLREQAAKARRQQTGCAH